MPKKRYLDPEGLQVLWRIINNIFAQKTVATAEVPGLMSPEDKKAIADLADTFKDYLPLTGGKMSGNIDLDGNTLFLSPDSTVSESIHGADTTIRLDVTDGVEIVAHQGEAYLKIDGVDVLQFINSKADRQHTHTVNEVSGIDNLLAKKADIRDVVRALEDKADKSHAHNVSDVNGIEDAVRAAVGQVTGLDGKVDKDGEDIKFVGTDIVMYGGGSIVDRNFNQIYSGCFHKHDIATAQKDGFMSKADKEKLDKIDETKLLTQILIDQTADEVQFAGVPIPTEPIPAATTQEAGVMSAADKRKLETTAAAVILLGEPIADSVILNLS